MKNDADLYYSLKTKEKELLQFLIERNQPEFTPIDISRETGISNRTIINRLKRLEAYGFVDPVLVKERVRSYRLTRNAKNRRGVNTKKETAVDYAVNVVNAEKLLQQLIIEGFSGQELIEEFKVRIRNYDNGTKKFLKEAKEAYKDSDFGE